MKKLLLKSLFIILPIIIISVLSEVFLNHSLINNSFYRIDNSSNILILGNSHPECALNDSLMDHCINLAQSADCYFYTYYKLKKLIEANSTIRTLILEYTNNVFDVGMNNWTYGEEYLGSKYPKYSQLISTEDKTFLFYKNPSAYFIGSKDALIAKSKLFFKRNTQPVYKNLGWGGYLFLVRDKIPQIKKEFTKFDISKSNLNSKSISTLNILYLKKIVGFCKLNNIKLILFRSPLHQLYKRDYEIELTHLIKNDFCNIPFWDYSHYPLADYEFGDLEHLNYKGASRFSKIINIRLKNEHL